MHIVSNNLLNAIVDCEQCTAIINDVNSLPFSIITTRFRFVVSNSHSNESKFFRLFEMCGVANAANRHANVTTVQRYEQSQMLIVKSVRS